MKSFFSAMFLLLLLGGCVEFTAPVCNPSNTVDVAGLPGNYTFSMMGENIKFSFKQDGPSKYEITVFDGEETVTDRAVTCSIDGKTYLSSAEPNDSGRYEIFSIEFAGEILLMDALIADQEALSEAGIQSEYGYNFDDKRILIIDNRNQDLRVVLNAMESIFPMKLVRD